MQTITLNISDMQCPACVMRLESLENELEGIKRISANYKKQNMVVEFDESKVSMDEIRCAVIKTGYTIA